MSLARTLRLEAIAEGIETPGQLDELRGLGVRQGQGFFFARPLPADQAVNFLARTRRSLRPDGHPAAVARPRVAASG